MKMSLLTLSIQMTSGATGGKWELFKYQAQSKESIKSPATAAGDNDDDEEE